MSEYERNEIEKLAAALAELLALTTDEYYERAIALFVERARALHVK